MDCLTKQQWRELMRTRLKSFSVTEYQTANQQIRERFFRLGEVRDTEVVMIYYSLRREVATLDLITELLARGKRVALPVCAAGRNLVAKEIRSLAEVGPGDNFGLYEPLPKTPLIEPEQLDLVVTPGVAFDRSGNRLGHGLGYYDRFLGQDGLQAVKLGLAYEFQVVARLPSDEFDVGMDALLTPGGLITTAPFS
jgi:5-formyltetrahydrofolate cyclo-ligase